MTGHAIKCIVCKDDVDEDLAAKIPQMGGLVCQECRRNLLWAQAYLKRGGMLRCVNENDVNQWNFKRFSTTDET